METAAPSGQPSFVGSFSAFPFARLGRYLYNHNPFYVISAALVLGGLHVLFHDRDALALPPPTPRAHSRTARAS